MPRSGGTDLIDVAVTGKSRTHQLRPSYSSTTIYTNHRFVACGCVHIRTHPHLFALRQTRTYESTAEDRDQAIFCCNRVLSASKKSSV
jgi:hypothetical protein